MRAPHRPTGRGGSVFVQPGPGNTKMGEYGHGSLVWVEGRLDAILSDSADAWTLRPARDVAAAEDVARAALGVLAGEPLVAPGEVRRFDLAHEFTFDTQPEGLAFLRTLAGMCPPRRKLDVWKGQDGQPQTVYVRQAKSGEVTERAYDKGVESGSHRPGLRIRYEAQRRPVKSKRMTPQTVASVDLRSEFGRSLHPYVSGSETLVAAGPDATLDLLMGQVARGELSMARAERMAGTVEVLRRYGRAVYPDVQQQQRRIRDLRAAGVALEEELPPAAVVPVGRLLADAIEAFNA